MSSTTEQLGVPPSDGAPTLAPETAPSAVPSQPSCPQCGSIYNDPTMPICRDCGFYASLGTYVEVQHEAEVAEQAPPPSHLEVWVNLLPAWGWLTVFCVLAIIVESVLGRLTTEPESELRERWSVYQFLIGGLALLSVHTYSYVRAILNSTDYNLLDIVLKPVKIWEGVVNALPRTRFLIFVGSTSLTATLMAMIVVGGLPYHILWSWKVRERAKPNLMAAALSHMQQGESEGDLEESMDDFVAHAASEGLLDGNFGQDAGDAKRVYVDCVIIGYQTTIKKPRRLKSIILARENKEELVAFARVAKGWDEETEKELLAELPKLHRFRPLIEVRYKANWVNPFLTCRTSATELPDKGGYVDVQFEEMLSKIEVELPQQP